MASDLDLAAMDLKQYTINTLNSLGKEVEEQFEKWDKPSVGFLDKLTGAHGDAAAEQVKVLKDEEEEKRRAFERALLVLNIIGIGATAWLGATLELKVGPKLFFEYEANAGTVLIPISMLKKIHNEYHSKIFGDAMKDLAAFLFETSGEKFAPSEYKEPDAAKVVYTPNATRFGQCLFEEVDRQRMTFATDLNRMTQQISHSLTFGQSIIARILRENHNAACNGRANLIAAGYKLIDDLLNTYRGVWAEKWYYYGYDPPEPMWSRVKHEFERQIWAIWLLQQHFRVENQMLETYTIVGASGGVLNTSGGFASTIKDSPIVVHLNEEFNAPVMEMILHGPPRDKDGCQTQVDKLNQWAINIDQTLLKGLLEGRKRTLKSVGALWEN